MRELLHRSFARLSNRQFLLVAAVVIGLWAGLSAVALKVSVHFVQRVLQSAGQHYAWLYFVSPVIGISLNLLLIRILFAGGIAKGNAHVLMAIAKNSSRLKPRETYAHLVTSGLTVGFGGSVGLESPIVQTGSAIGSFFSSFFPIGYRDRTLLLACGATAGIATAFNAPIAGVLFALEVLLVNVSIAAFIPLLIAGATGALCSKIILSEGILLSFRNTAAFNYHNTFYYVFLGISCGLVSAYYIRVTLAIERLWSSIFTSRLLKLGVGGLLLGLTILFFPALFGEGYNAIKSMATTHPGELFIGSPLLPFVNDGPVAIGLLILALSLVKVFAVSFTLNAGGNGGNFAPSLLVGAALGFSISSLANASGIVSLPVGNFCLVAMAGVLTGIFHSPLTAIFLIAEITGGYELIIPLMIVAALSTAVSKYLNTRSLDEEKLQQLSSTVRLGRDSHILAELSLRDFIERDFLAIAPGSTLRQLTEKIARSSRNTFPVVDAEGILLGIISLENIREIMFRADQYDSLSVDQLMQKPLATADISEDVDSVMDRFETSAVWNMPVIDRGKYAGFISKSKIFSAYRDHFRKD